MARAGWLAVGLRTACPGRGRWYNAGWCRIVPKNAVRGMFKPHDPARPRGKSSELSPRPDRNMAEHDPGGAGPPTKPRILVSSAVYGLESLLDQIFALLQASRT